MNRRSLLARLTGGAAAIAAASRIDARPAFGLPRDAEVVWIRYVGTEAHVHAAATPRVPIGMLAQWPVGAVPEGWVIDHAMNAAARERLGDA